MQQRTGGLTNSGSSGNEEKNKFTIQVIQFFKDSKVEKDVKNIDVHTDMQVTDGSHIIIALVDKKDCG